MGYAFVYIILALFCRPEIFAQELTNLQLTTIIPSVTEIFTAKKTQGNDTSYLDILAPSSPRNLTIKNATDTSLTLQWQIPDKPNGLLRGYRIYFTQGNYTDTRTDKTNPEEPVKNYILNELKPDTIYSIQVKAFSAKHEGNLSAPALGRTDIMGPSPPILTNISCEYNNSIMVEFNRSARFPDSIDEYYIDVFESGVLIQHMDLPTEKNFISSSYVFHNITPKVRYEVQVYAASKSNRTGNLVRGEKSRLASVFVAEGCFVQSEHLTELWAGILAGFLCAVGVLFSGGGVYLIWNFNKKYLSAYVMSGHLAVDSFFFISGFLLAYLCFKNQLSKKGLFEQIRAIPSMILHRYLRLTPAVLITYLFVVFLFKYTGNGPLFAYRVNAALTEPCKKHWWSVFLYIQDYYNFNLREEFCITRLFYLLADMQNFI